MTSKNDVTEKVMNTENNCNSYGLKNSNMKWTRRLKQNIKEAWAFRSKVTVEPLVVCYMLPSVLVALAAQNLFLEKSCLVNLKYDVNTCKHIMQTRTSHLKDEEIDVQNMVTVTTSWSFPLQSALPVILTLFFGVWSDKTGKRKPFMILPIFGKFVAALGVIISTVYFFQIGVNETALLEGLPPALTGGRVAFTMAVYSYVTDITSETERTFRLGIITVILTLCRPIGNAVSGYMINRFGYYCILSVACVFYFTGFVYAILMLKTKPRIVVENEKKDCNSCSSMFSMHYLVATVNVAFKKREYSRRLQIFLIVLAYILLMGPVLGEVQYSYYFARYKFKFTEVDYSLYVTYSIIIGIIGSFITLYLFSKRWEMDDSIIGVIACLSRFSASVVYALAPTRTIFYISPVLDMFSSAGATSLRSIATKLVDKDEIGKTSSIISMSEALVPLIYSPIYSQVYLATIETMPGAFYLISTALAVPAIVLLILIYHLRKKEARARIEDETAPETHEERKPSPL